MTRTARRGGDVADTEKETVNGPPPSKETIEHLLETANDAAGAARNAWLGFLGIMAYLLVTIASTTHTDLLLNSPVSLPVVGVELPLIGFFGFAPLIFLMLHFGLYIQHGVTAKKFNALNAALNRMTAHDLTPFKEEIRGRVHHYAFAQFISGKYGDQAEKHETISFHREMIRIMQWGGLVILPVLTLLYFQIGFLAYHDQAWTNWHRLMLLADLALAWAFWPVISYDKDRWIDCVQADPYGRKWLNYSATALTVLFSVFVATIPDEPLDKFTSSFPEKLVAKRDGRQIFKPTAWLFEGKFNQATLGLDSWFARNLVVSTKDLVDDDAGIDENEFSHDLRDRDLRYGQFSQTDLSHADFAYALLHRANFEGASLESANFEHAKIQGTQFVEASLDNTDFNHSVADNETSFQEATLTHATIQCADWEGVTIFRATFDFAQLNGSNLNGANLWNISRRDVIGGAQASFKFTDFSMVNADECNGGPRASDSKNFKNPFEKVRTELVAAYLGFSSFEVNDFYGAYLEAADFSHSSMKGANFSVSEHFGANFSDTTLKGVNLDDHLFSGSLIFRDSGKPFPINLSNASFDFFTENELSGFKKHRNSEYIAKATSELLSRTLDDAADSQQRFLDIFNSLKERPFTHADERAARLASSACDDTTGSFMRVLVQRYMLPDKLFRDVLSLYKHNAEKDETRSDLQLQLSKFFDVEFSKLILEKILSKKAKYCPVLFLAKDEAKAALVAELDVVRERLPKFLQ